MPSRRSVRRSFVHRDAVPAALAVVVGLLLAGCGGDDDPTTNAAGDGDAAAVAGESTDEGEVSDELARVIEDAGRMAPALESALRGTEYPVTLEEALQALGEAGIEPSEGNVVNGYEYDPDTVEFVLCIEGPSGTFASYDTRPMSLFTTGETGGCPAP